MQCCIGLATKKPPLNETSDLKESLEEIAPSGAINEEDPTATPDLIYSAVQLDDTKTQIRLIKLLPGQPGDPVIIELIIVKNVGTQPYEALSYVWGSPDAKVTMKVNDKPFEVTANLYDALSCLRQTEEERVLWVDAICINQAHDFEKSSQVSMMGDIYRNAADVIIFLGKERDGSGMVMQYLDLEDVDKADFTLLAAEGSVSTTTGRGLREETEGDLKDRRLIGERIRRCGFGPVRFLEAADAFIKRPWWYRIWTVQEYALARNEPRWYCGRTWTSTAHLRDRISQLKNYLLHNANPLIGDVAVSTSAQIAIGQEFIKIAERSWTINMQLTKRNPQANSALPSHFLLTLAYRQSTDPRDRIYALREMIDPISKQVFEPDYSVPVDDVFMKLTAYVLCYDRFGHIYAHYQTSRSPDQSSWVLDFTKPISVHGLSHLSQYMKERLPNPAISSAPRLNDSEIRKQWSRNIGRLCIYNCVLSVMGVEIDVIDHSAILETETDIRKLGLVWKLEGLIQNHHPSKILPETARHFFPASCLIPFPTPLKEHFNSIGSEVLGVRFGITGKLPGYLHIWAEMMKFQCNLAPQTIFDGLTCKNWENEVLSTEWEIRYGRASRLYGAFYEPYIAETVLGGACFDLPNLKKQIMSVTLPERLSPGTTKDAESADEKSLDDSTRVPASNSAYTPQYSHVKSILRQCRNKEELEILKKTAIDLAEVCCSVVSLHLAKQGPTGPQLIAELKATVLDYFTRQLSNYRSMSEKCVCEGDTRARHQALLKEKIATAETDLEKIEAKVDHFGKFKMESIQQSNDLEQTVTREYTSMFVTDLGLFGVSFQQQAGMGSGCKVVLLDGIPAPMVVERVDGSTDRIRGAAHVVGITHIDVEKLVELGMFKRRQFNIM